MWMRRFLPDRPDGKVAAAGSEAIDACAPLVAIRPITGAPPRLSRSGGLSRAATSDVALASWLQIVFRLPPRCGGASASATTGMVADTTPRIVEDRIARVGVVGDQDDDRHRFQPFALPMRSIASTGRRRFGYRNYRNTAVDHLPPSYPAGGESSGKRANGDRRRRATSNPTPQQIFRQREFLIGRIEPDGRGDQPASLSTSVPLRNNAARGPETFAHERTFARRRPPARLRFRPPIDQFRWKPYSSMTARRVVAPHACSGSSRISASLRKKPRARRRDRSSPWSRGRRSSCQGAPMARTGVVRAIDVQACRYVTPRLPRYATDGEQVLTEPPRVLVVIEHAARRGTTRRRGCATLAAR